MAYGILIPWPGIEPMPSALVAWSLNHWTTREVNIFTLLLFKILLYFYISFYIAV